METTTSNNIRFYFNPHFKKYIFLYVAFFLLISIIGIVILPFWLLGIGQWYSRKYFEKLECELSDQNLRFKQGILFQFEKTIPLDNIQDLTFMEGPLLRYLQLSIIKIETAGQSIHNASKMSLVGLIDAQVFRRELLARRSALNSKPQDSENPMKRISEQLDSIHHLLDTRLPKQ